MEKEFIDPGLDHDRTDRKYGVGIDIITKNEAFHG